MVATVTEKPVGAAELGVPSQGALFCTAAGIPMVFRDVPAPDERLTDDPAALRLHLEYCQLQLLRDFDQLLCLEGLTGVEHLPHQIETIRKVLRRFHGRVLLADEVGLGKTIEACLLLREYLLRGLVKRVLILTPSPLVSQWREELFAKFHLQFSTPPRTGVADTARFWRETDRVLVSLAFAKHPKRAEWVADAPWDLVIVDEAHHCKNRATQNWRLINSLKRRHLFLLSATPVQNNLLELYNLLTLLEPGHLKTESEFKRQHVRRGNPRDPCNRERLRSLLGEVMVRNTRSLVQMDLPARYAHTILAQPVGDEALLYDQLARYLRSRQLPAADSRDADRAGQADEEDAGARLDDSMESDCPIASSAQSPDTGELAALPPLGRRQLATLLLAAGSHVGALAQSLDNIVGADPAAKPLVELASRIGRTAKDERLLELLHQNRGEKMLIFATFRRTLEHLQRLLDEKMIPYVTYSGAESESEKDAAVAAFRETVPVMLCSESGGEGRNLQFANTLVNFDLPWNPMRIEQRVGRIHRIGQTRDVFIFNLCTAESLEARLLTLLEEKIRMFELVVGEVGSILGNLQGGEEFESLVLNLWLRSRDDGQLQQSFDALGQSLVDAQEEYLHAKQLDDALFGEEFQ
ncbi:MAG: DEAD/DEAH box helicase family protein [Pirellulales bacterium]|nr:DEAD/DEAH box helicase family protein [Pirellulales bacterium]